MLLSGGKFVEKLGLKIYPKKFSAEMEFREIGSCWSR
jgi:hypothetical protein